MPTTTTVHDFKVGLVAALTARTALLEQKISYAWPGPETATQGIYLGSVAATSEIPTAKAGRKQRQETYTVEVLCYAIDAGGTADSPSTAAAQAYTFLAEVDETLADDPKAGVASVQWSTLLSFVEEMLPAEWGWACLLTALIQVHARLT